MTVVGSSNGGARHGCVCFTLARVALVRKIEVSRTGSGSRVHGEVECGYSVFESGGQRYLQLDTYGSAERAIPGKTSQSLQLDETGARRLKRLIEETFPGL